MHPKICLSIGNVTYEEALKHLSNVALAEIRMDLLNLPDEQLLTLFRLGRSTIATYRSHENFDLLGVSIIRPSGWVAPMLISILMFPRITETG